MKSFKLIFIGLIFNLFISLFMSESIALAEGMSFSVSPIFSENKNEGSASYFHMKVSPSSTETLSVSLTNTTDKKREYFISINNASTSSNGTIDYTRHIPEEELSGALTLQDIAEYPNKVTLDAYETQILDITLPFPSEAFNGVLLGAIFVAESDTTISKDDAVGITNRFSYTIPILIYENDEQLDAKLKVMDFLIEENQNELQVKIQNPVSNILPDVTLHTSIKLKESNEILQEEEKTSLEFAPNSFWNYSLSMNDTIINSPGIYEVTINFSSDYGSWEWTEVFEIEKEKIEQKKDVVKQAATEEGQESSKESQQGRTFTYTLLSSVFLLAVAIFIIFKRVL